MRFKMGRYRHYKGGEYEVLDIAFHSENKQEMVVYRAANDGTLWTRPKSMFCGHVHIDGKDRPRFSFVGR